MVKTVEETTTDLWWTGMVQGVAALLFGIAAVAWPGLTLKVLVYLFSAFVLAWGILSIVEGVMAVTKRSTWWLTVLFGVFGAGVGLYLIRHPLASFATVILLIGFTLIIRGVFDIIAAFVDNHTATGKLIWLLAGAAGIIAGVVILNQPVAGGVAFVWILGLYSLVFGPLMIAMSLDERKALKD